MNAAIVIVQLAILSLGPVFDGAIASQTRLRVAIVGFKVTAEIGRSTQLENALVEALRRDQRVSVIDDSLVRPAITGIGYDGSINMSKDEARKLGAAIGCDFFIVGKTEALSRSDHENESHEVAYAAIMIVDGRSGALQVFDFVSSKAATRENAISAVLKDLNERAQSYIDQMIQAGASASATRLEASSNSEPKNREPIEDIPADGSRRAVGFTPPEFLNRVRPDYPPQADLADITATVEAMAVFRANGQVGNIEITRWAGFGLEESSERAIRQLKYKPATRDGRPINVRALIQYNFRRAK